jgi:hypothetical protein
MRKSIYNVNDKVLYRGDNSKTPSGHLQKWNIIKGGSNFITIRRETEPGRLFNPMKDLQIVKPEDIYYENDIIDNRPTSSHNDMETRNIVPPNGNNITFAPVINVNTKEIEPDIEMPPMIKDELRETDCDAPEIKYKKVEDSVPCVIEPHANQIDFSNLMIKKIDK